MTVLNMFAVQVCFYFKFEFCVVVDAVLRRSRNAQLCLVDESTQICQHQLNLGELWRIKIEPKLKAYLSVIFQVTEGHPDEFFINTPT